LLGWEKKNQKEVHTERLSHSLENILIQFYATKDGPHWELNPGPPPVKP